MPAVVHARRREGAAHALMAALGLVVGLLARLWLSTLRVSVTLDAKFEAEKGPWVFGFWHGRQWPLLAWSGCRGAVVLVSWSRDGSLQARALAMQGLSVVRGSSSRGGARGLVVVVRKLREGKNAAFAVDGPRGPRGVAKGGVVTAARAGGGWLVPLGSAMERGFAFDRAWDNFGLAWPFSRVEVVVGTPIDPASPRAREDLEDAIGRANERAAVLGMQRWKKRAAPAIPEQKTRKSSGALERFTGRREDGKEGESVSCFKPSE